MILEAALGMQRLPLDERHGHAAVLGRDDIGSLEAGKRADLFTMQLNTIGYAGALHDPVAATLFCARQNAQTTVVDGSVIVDGGEIATMDMAPVVEEHNRWSLKLAAAS